MSCQAGHFQSLWATKALGPAVIVHPSEASHLWREPKMKVWRLRVEAQSPVVCAQGGDHRHNQKGKGSRVLGPTSPTVMEGPRSTLQELRTPTWQGMNLSIMRRHPQTGVPGSLSVQLMHRKSGCLRVFWRSGQRPSLGMGSVCGAGGVWGACCPAHPSEGERVMW